ncbi:MAG: class I SAM-dependent methyltransferase [Acidimicrobiales bacterium]
MSQSEGQYNQTFNKALQHLWGDGFLSPGGPVEVAAMLDGVDVDGRDVLDVGSGLGACGVLLAERYGAASVLGVDIEAHLIEHSTERAEANQLRDRVRFQLIEPGPLPLGDDSFDLVFPQDAIVHIPDKPAFYAEVTRVLKPGGVFVGSDWLRGGEETGTERALAWLEFVHLNFRMQNISQLKASLEEAGFQDVRLNDRNHWYRTEIENELAAVTGDRYDELVEMIGHEQAAYRQESSRRKQEAIDDGFLRPTHFFGRTPPSDGKT